MSADVWVEAARPKTLPAAVAPVLVGTGVADGFVAWRFVAALVVALALQVAVNYANDYFDGVGGVDTAERLGPRRAVAAGLVSPARMRLATGLALLIAGLAGLALAAAAGWWLVAVGAVAVVATLAYSGGRRPYASFGLGEVFVFVFFGLVATAGTTYVLDERWSWLAVGAGVPVGLIATAILVVNNLRDIPTDTATGKHTLAVRLGEARTRDLFTALVGGALVLDAVLVAPVGSLWPLLGWVGGPLVLRSILRVRRGAAGRRLIGALHMTGRAHLLHGVGLAVGLLLAT